jgi:hypothetical protein
VRVEDIRKAAQDQIDLVDSRVAAVGFHLPGRWGKTDKRRMCPRGPIGDVVQDNMDGRGIYVLFVAHEVLDFLRDFAPEDVLPKVRPGRTASDRLGPRLRGMVTSQGPVATVSRCFLHNVDHGDGPCVEEPEEAP